MRLTEFDIFGYEIPMKILGKRKGLILRVRDENGGEGFGEIAPLENWSHETYDESLTFLKSVKKRLLMQELDPIPFPPSVMFGVESALVQLKEPITSHLDFTMTKLYSDLDPPKLNDHEVKLKLGKYELEEAIHMARQYLDMGSKIRIDLNRKWSLEKSVAFCKHFEPDDFVYIEEPTNYFMELEAFSEKTGFSFALDEHLLCHPMDRIINLRGLSHLILKPTMQGGLNSCREIIGLRPDIECVFSSSYESDIGLAHIVRIGCTLTPDKPIGIDTAKLMESSLLTEPIDFSLGRIEKDVYNNMPIDYSKLEAL